jgi:hypothetical protein
VGDIDVLVAVREIQLPLLAALLIVASVAKAGRAIMMRSVDGAAGPTALFPLRLRHTAAIVVCASELALGIGLLLTAGRLGAGPPALAFRGATALLFLIAVAALRELSDRDPDAGCGCFGDLSTAPVGWRTLSRSAVLCVAALATIGMGPLSMPGSPGQAGLLLAVAAAEFGVLAALSPEIGEILVRLGHPDPCEVRRVPVARTMAALRASDPWLRWRSTVLTMEPTDIWREGCWRLVVFPGTIAGRNCDVVFAVHLAARRAEVRVGVRELAPLVPLIPMPRSVRVTAPLDLSSRL